MKSYIPTINISSLLDGKFISKESRKTIQEIKKACIEIGFFQVVGHGLKTKDIIPINRKDKNILKILKLFLNCKYKWGGKTYDGID